jgi:hypothetical protein
VAACADGKRLNLTNLTALFLSNCTADNDELNLAIMSQWFPNLQTLTLSHGGYDVVKKDELLTNSSKVIFSKLECLNISNNALDEKEGISQVVNAIGSLRVLDLSNNKLNFTPELNDRTHTLWMDLSGNYIYTLFLLLN